MGVANDNKLALVAAVCMVVIMAAPAAEAAFSCGTVSKSVLGCLPYLRGAPGPSPGCCGGLKSLAGQARTPDDRQTICRCLKQLAASIKGCNFKTAAGVPRNCGLTVPSPLVLAPIALRFIEREPRRNYRK